MNIFHVFTASPYLRNTRVYTRIHTAFHWDRNQFWPSMFLPYIPYVQLSRHLQHNPTCKDERKNENALKILCQCLRVKDYPTVLNSVTSCNVFSLRHCWKQRGLVIWKGEISHHFTPSLSGHWDCDWYEKSPKGEVPDDLWCPWIFLPSLLTKECRCLMTESKTLCMTYPHFIIHLTHISGT